MIDWRGIDTVLLDMDGTLLDLHFDNHFWLKHVPRRFAEKHGLDAAASERELGDRYRKIEGTLDWYCVDHWSEALELDIPALKEEMAHLIAVHPRVEDFLAALKAAGKRRWLVTNAHGKSLGLKMRVTGLSPWFDRITCAHDLGLPKENPRFWGKLQTIEAFDPQRSLLIDDSPSVLRSARQYGIAHCYGIRRPDTRKPPVELDEFEVIDGFGQIMP
ncbi:MAG TPA: GMP/IMP nucleotidase [Gammaproteobacteria bacterium]|nr:GMP/IMP nucleotidase [Gammaproteobacteria bacterium]